MRKLFFVLSIPVFLAFVFFTYLVKKDIFRQVDFDIAVKLKDNVPLRLDPLFNLAGNFGSVFIISFVLLGLLVIWKTSVINKLIVLFIYFGAQGLEFFLKERLRQPGPTFQFQRHFTNTYFDKDYVQAGYSYPSGHSFRAIFIALLIVYFSIRKWGISSMKTWIISAGACAGAAFIMLGKMVLGAHWSTDIIGGAILAVSMVCLAISFLPFSGQGDRAPSHEPRSKQPRRSQEN